MSVIKKFRKRYPIFLIIYIVFLLGLGMVREGNIKHAQITMRYYSRFHNDNEYLYSSKGEFEGIMNEELVKKTTERYYKVYYGSNGKYYKAEMHYPAHNIHGTYFFDDEERMVWYKEGDKTEIWNYGQEVKTLVVVEDGGLKAFIEYTYEGEKLEETVRYEPVNVMLEYIEYDHKTMRYRKYDKLGEFVEEGKMVVGK